MYRTIIFLTTMIVILGCEPSESNNASLALESPAGENSSLPYLIKGDDGNLYMSWVEERDSGWIDLKYSVLKGDAWETPELIASGNNWFVNWADYPQMAVDQKGNMIAHFLAKSSAGTYSYDVNVMYKPADGEWSGPVIPHDDGTPTEHGFVTMLPRNDGTFLLAWLDGRNTGGGDHSDHDSHEGGGAMTLRSAVMGMSGKVTNGVALDERVCDCCQTGGAMTSQGPVIVYRDRSEVEVRDMAFVRKKENEWSDPAMVGADGWMIEGCPVNGPRVASIDDAVASGWFTGVDDRSMVKVAFMNSDNTFDPPIVVDDSASMGRVDIVMLDQENAIVSWLDLDDDIPQIKYRLVSRDGRLDDPVLVTETSASRASGFPQMEVMDGALYFAWTNLTESGSMVEVRKTEY